VDERVFVGANGQRAVEPAHVLSVQITNPTDRNTTCGDEPYARVWAWNLVPGAPEVEDEFELETAEGSRITLDPHRGVWVAPGSGAIACSEIGGAWRGTSGDLRDHSGTFTMVYDSVQTLLRLVEA
jgi:hypothetical protein